MELQHPQRSTITLSKYYKSAVPATTVLPDRSQHHSFSWSSDIVPSFGLWRLLSQSIISVNVPTDLPLNPPVDNLVAMAESAATPVVARNSAPISKTLPHLHDTMDVLFEKLSALKDKTRRDPSVAAATDYLATTTKKQDTECKAVAEMMPDERQYYEAFKAKTLDPKLPVITWETDRGRIPKSARHLKSAQRHAEALNRLYCTDKAEICHATWFAKTHTGFMPLVKAIDRAIGAERDAVGGQTIATAAQLAELQTLGYIISTTARIMYEDDRRTHRRAVNIILRELIESRKQLRKEIKRKQALTEAANHADDASALEDAYEGNASVGGDGAEQARPTVLVTQEDLDPTPNDGQEQPDPNANLDQEMAKLSRGMQDMFTTVDSRGQRQLSPVAESLFGLSTTNSGPGARKDGTRKWKPSSTSDSTSADLKHGGHSESSADGESANNNGESEATSLRDSPDRDVKGEGESNHETL
ncbi:hypothetical protein LTR60_001139 [Cryomyces antarcticus]|nr:hypothetical protein LTR60_001139 [Cryomyces antarcticus]